MTDKQRDILRLSLLAVILLILFYMQTMPAGLHIGRARPYLLIPFTVFVGMFERELPGAYFGLAAGLLWDTVSTEISGFHALFLLAAGCASGLLITHLMRNNHVTAIIFSSATVFLHTFIYWLLFAVFPGGADAAGLLFKFYLPNALLTCALSPVLYWLMRMFRKALIRKEKGEYRY